MFGSRSIGDHYSNTEVVVFCVCAFPTRPKKKKEGKINIKKEKKKERRRKQKNTTTHKIERLSCICFVVCSCQLRFHLYFIIEGIILYLIYIYISLFQSTITVPSLLYKTRLLRLC